MKRKWSLIISCLILFTTTIYASGEDSITINVPGDYATIQDNIIISRGVTVCHSKEIKENILEPKHMI